MNSILINKWNWLLFLVKSNHSLQFHYKAYLDSHENVSEVNFLTSGVFSSNERCSLVAHYQNGKYLLQTINSKWTTLHAWLTICQFKQLYSTQVGMWRAKSTKKNKNYINIPKILKLKIWYLFSYTFVIIGVLLIHPSIPLWNIR